MKKRILGMLCVLCISVISVSQGIIAEAETQNQTTASQSLNTTIETASQLEYLKLYDDIFTAENNARCYKFTVNQVSCFSFSVNSDAKGEVMLLNSKGKVLSKWPLPGKNWGFTYYESDAQGVPKYDPTLLLSDTNGRCVGEEELVEPGTYYVKVTASKEQFSEETSGIRFHAMGDVEELIPNIKLNRTSAVYTGKKIAMPKVKTLKGSEKYGPYNPSEEIKYNQIIDRKTGKRVKSIKKIGRYIICNNDFVIEKNQMGIWGDSCALFTVTPKKGTLKGVESKKKGQIQVTAKKYTAAGRYQIQISTDKKFKRNVQEFNTKGIKQTVKKLKSGKKYYVRVRYYKNVSIKYIHGQSEPEPIYGKWSTVKTVVCK